MKIKIVSYEKKASKKGPYFSVKLESGTEGLCFDNRVPDLVGVEVDGTLKESNDTMFINIDKNVSVRPSGNNGSVSSNVQGNVKNTSVETMVMSYLKDITIAMINKDFLKDKVDVEDFLGEQFISMYNTFVTIIKGDN